MHTSSPHRKSSRFVRKSARSAGKSTSFAEIHQTSPEYPPAGRRPSTHQEGDVSRLTSRETSLDSPGGGARAAPTALSIVRATLLPAASLNGDRYRWCTGGVSTAPRSRIPACMDSWRMRRRQFCPRAGGGSALGPGAAGRRAEICSRVACRPAIQAVAPPKPPVTVCHHVSARVTGRHDCRWQPARAHGPAAARRPNGYSCAQFVRSDPLRTLVESCRLVVQFRPLAKFALKQNTPMDTGPYAIRYPGRHYLHLFQRHPSTAFTSFHASPGSHARRPAAQSRCVPAVSLCSFRAVLGGP